MIYDGDVLEYNGASDMLLEREGWVLLKIPRGDIDGVGEVRCCFGAERGPDNRRRRYD